MSFGSSFAEKPFDVGKLLMHFGVDVTVDGLCLAINLLLDITDLACQFIGDLGLLSMLVLERIFQNGHTVFQGSDSIV